MKKIIAAILVSISTISFAQKQGVVHDFPITRVLDGDTVAFKANFLPDPLKKELSIRIYGVDTPEKGAKAKCPQENEMGIAATKFTGKVVNEATKRQVVIMSWDKYGGRVLGDIILDGKSLRDLLIQKGYAREYFGEAKKSWCN
jgi:micrococcal nuclease